MKRCQETPPPRSPSSQKLRCRAPRISRGPDRVRLRRHPRPVASEGVEGVLHDRHRVQLDEARTCLLVRLEVALELLAQMRLPEGDVAAPADPAVAAIGAAEVLDPGAVVADRLGGREVDLLVRRAQLGVDEPEEALQHRPLERARPARRRRHAVLVRVLVHVERVDVREREPLVVDHPRGELVLRHRPHGEDGDERSPLVAGGADAADEVLGEAPVELRGGVDDRDPEVGIRMVGELGPADPRGRARRPRGRGS